MLSRFAGCLLAIGLCAANQNAVVLAGARTLARRSAEEKLVSNLKCDLFPVWNRDRIADDRGRPLYVETPPPVLMGDRIAILGTPTVTWRTSTVFATADPPFADYNSLGGAMLDWGPAAAMTARAISKPPDSHRFLSPRYVYDHKAERLEVIWGESSDTTAHSELFVEELWHAELGGNGWSAADLMFRGRQIWWNNSQPQPLLVQGKVLVAIGASDTSMPGGHNGLLLLLGRERNWQQSWVETGGPLPTNVALSIDSQGTLSAAFLGAILKRGSGSIMNAIWIARSVDHGATWSTPSLAADLGSARGANLELLANSDTLRMVWTATTTRSAALVSLLSVDAGQTWAAARQIPLPDEIEGLSAALGGSAIVGVARVTRTDSLLAVVWPVSRPPNISILSARPAESLPRMTMVGHDSVLVVWGVGVHGAYPMFPALDAPALSAELLSLRCD